MKLRNKETGEITEATITVCKWTSDYEDLLTEAEYENISDVMRDWEDYKPAEPLIKDKKIRKAVRAWAEAFDVEKIYYDAKMLRLHDNKCKTVIGIKYPILGVWDRKEPYTIDELCGEED